MTIAGSVSCGTLRTQDLLPKFMACLLTNNPAAYDGVAMGPLYHGYVRAVQAGDNYPWWATQEAMELFIQVSQHLNEVAPEGHYFGAHPGDGSDFGFWPIEDPQPESRQWVLMVYLNEDQLGDRLNAIKEKALELGLDFDEDLLPTYESWQSR